MIAKNVGCTTAGAGCLPPNSPLHDLVRFPLSELNLHDEGDRKEFGRIWSVVQARADKVEGAVKSGHCLANPSMLRTSCCDCARAARGHKLEDIFYEQQRLKELMNSLRSLRQAYRK